MSDHDHEYTLTVRPNAHLRVAYSTEDDAIERAFVALEYGRDGVERDEGGEGIEWRGYEITLARDGEAVLGRDTRDTLDRNVERLLDSDVSLLDNERVQRGIDTASGYGRRLKERLGAVREQRRTRLRETADPTGMVEPPETVEVPGPGETTIDASLGETTATFELYEDDGGNWRWRLTREDGDTLAVSATGYDSRDAAEETITVLKTNALGAEIEG
jgi:uncharacterized protein YegP (UPF0339 family)